MNKIVIPLAYPNSPPKQAKFEREFMKMKRRDDQEKNRVDKRKESKKQRKDRRRLEGLRRKQASIEFYQSDAWFQLRYQAIKLANGHCQACGVSGKETQIHVDHIKPRSKYPNLELVLSNLQILCRPCNLGKSNLDETDW